MKPALVILAAGMGSRYGGLKQLDPVGPTGETLLEYSVYDAVKAGFGKIVFVIRRDFEAAFRQQISSKFPSGLQIEYAFQEIDDLPIGFRPPSDREKPWGTAHAVYSARNVVDSSFAVINADDFYGRSAYEKLAGFLRNETGGKIPSWCLIGYLLRNTLSTHGPVSRAVCTKDEKGYLLGLEEHTGIKSDEIGCMHGIDKAGGVCSFKGDETVSMNCFGFTREIFPMIEEGLRKFLDRQSDSLNTEFYIPELAGEAFSLGKAKLRVLLNETEEQWFGLTYKEDLKCLRAAIARMVDLGQYPEPLWP